MFTGIIQAVGRIRDNEEIGDGLRIHVEAPELGLDTVKIGDSIAINGACMTVVEVDEKRFKVEVSAESLSKTAGLDGWGYVNLEKAMRLGDRLDGHIVSGHVDGVGEVDAFDKEKELVTRIPQIRGVEIDSGISGEIIEEAMKLFTHGTDGRTNKNHKS